jgi:hypothetical protein
LILCFRAEEKIEMVKTNGKLEVRKKESLTGKDGWIPICEKSVPFECTCSFLLLASNPGIPHPIKLQEQHKPFFSPTNAVDEYAGEQLAKWAAGGKEKLTQGDGAGVAASVNSGVIKATDTVRVSAPESQDAPASLLPAYLEQIALSESVVECSKTLNVALKDMALNVFEVKELQEAGKQKILALRTVKAKP